MSDYVYVLKLLWFYKGEFKIFSGKAIECKRWMCAYSLEMRNGVSFCIICCQVLCFQWCQFLFKDSQWFHVPNFKHCFVLSDAYVPYWTPLTWQLMACTGQPHTVVPFSKECRGTHRHGVKKWREGGPWVMHVYTCPLKWWRTEEIISFVVWRY